MSVSNNLKAIGITAGAVAIGAGLLLSSRSGIVVDSQKKILLVKDHATIAKEVPVRNGKIDSAGVEIDDPTYDVVVIGGGVFIH